MMNSVENMNAAKELAEKILDKIDREPESHNQDTWGYKNECETSACIAGHAALINGDAMYNSWDENQGLYALQLSVPGYSFNNFGSYAMDQLNLSPLDASRLFYKTNNEQAKEALKYIAKGEDIPWDEIGYDTNA